MEIFKSPDCGQAHITHVPGDECCFCAHIHKTCEIYAILRGRSTAKAQVHAKQAHLPGIVPAVKPEYAFSRAS